MEFLEQQFARLGGTVFELASLEVHLSGDVLIPVSELNRLRHDPESMAGTIRDRWATFQSLFDYEPVFVVNGAVPALSDMRRRGGETTTSATVGTVLTGAAGSGGVATGRARVILDAADPEGPARRSVQSAIWI